MPGGLPRRAIAKYVEPRTAGPAAVGPILRDAEGFYSFAHPSFVDFHVAQRIFGEIAGGDSKFVRDDADEP